MVKAWRFIENRLCHSLKLKAISATGSFTAIYGNFLNVTKNRLTQPEAKSILRHRLRHGLFDYHL